MCLPADLSTSKTALIPLKKIHRSSQPADRGDSRFPMASRHRGGSMQGISGQRQEALTPISDHVIVLGPLRIEMGLN